MKTNRLAIWRPAKEIGQFPKCQSTAMRIVRLIVALPDGSVCIGWYFGGLLKQWRVDGSPSEFEVKYWMLLPTHPDAIHKAEI